MTDSFPSDLPGSLAALVMFELLSFWHRSCYSSCLLYKGVSKIQTIKYGLWSDHIKPAAFHSQTHAPADTSTYGNG